MSMGNTSAANSTDLDAFNQNPANILNQRWDCNSSVYFNIATNAGALLSSEFLSIDFYNDYFAEDDNGYAQYLTEQDKSNIYNEAGNEPVNFMGSTKILSVIYNSKNAGSFGLSLDERVAGNFMLNQDFLQVALYGNQSNSYYDFSETYLNDYWVREINLTYADRFKIKKNKMFDELSFGISIKPQLGIYYLKTQSNNLSVSTNDSNVIEGSGAMNFLYSGLTDNNHFKYSTDYSGFGLGFDAGVTVSLKDISKKANLKVGLSITDIGTLNWSKNTFTYFYDGTYVVTNITDKNQVDSLRDIIKGTKTPTGEFSTGLPTALRFGFSYNLFDKNKNDSLKEEIASISVDYYQGFNNNLGGTTKPIVGIGGEYNATKALSPRAGFAFGGFEKFVMSVGLGIYAGPVIIDLGTYNISSIFSPRGTSKLSAGMNIKFKIN